jgi:ANTAR domain
MTDRVASRSQSPAGSDLDAFRRHRGEAPAASSSALVSALNDLPVSDDPAVTFARLAEACVPGFADGCRVEISNGAEPPFRAAFPADSSAPDRSSSAAGRLAGPEQILHTPFRAPSRTGYSSYAGVVTHWWTGRAPSRGDAATADLMVKHLIALVDHERLMAAVAPAEDRAASLALEAISGRTINLAIGILMHQNGLPPEDAEDLLRQSARTAGRGMAQMAASVVRCGALADSAASHARPGPVVRGLSLVSSPPSRFLPASEELA